MDTAALLVVFAAAAAVDWLNCLWLRARDRGARGAGVWWAVVLEASQWAPIALALDDRLPIGPTIAASIAGSAVGSLLGFRASGLRT